MHELNDTQCDSIIALTLNKIAAQHHLHAIDLNPNILEHKGLSRSLVRCAYERGKGQREYVPITPPDTHFYDDDVGRDVWSYSVELARSIVATTASAERERAANKLSLTRSEAMLHCGEMTAGEWRTVSAVLSWMQTRIRDANAEFSDAARNGPAGAGLSANFWNFGKTE